LASWYDNSAAFKPATMKRQLAEEILAAACGMFSHERVRMKVTHKKKWNSVTCPSCGEQVPQDLMEGTTCAGCGSLAYYEKVT